MNWNYVSCCVFSSLLACPEAENHRARSVINNSYYTQQKKFYFLTLKVQSKFLMYRDWIHAIVLAGWVGGCKNGFNDCQHQAKSYVQFFLTLCSANFISSASVAMSQIRTVLSSEKVTTCLLSDMKSQQCVAFSWPANVRSNVLLLREKSRTLPSSQPTHISWPSARNFAPYAVSRNLVKLLKTSLERGLKIWTWNVKDLY